MSVVSTDRPPAAAEGRKVAEARNELILGEHSLCPGCGEPVALRLLLETLQELDLVQSTIGAKCSIFNSMLLTASSAIPADSARTSATGSPTYRTNSSARTGCAKAAIAGLGLLNGMVGTGFPISVAVMIA